MRTVSMIGAGKVGLAIALALDQKDWQVETLFHRSGPPSPKLIERFHFRPQILSLDSTLRIRSDVIFITTQDAGIENAARSIRRLIDGTPAVLIASGALSSDTIGFLRDQGCKVGSLHPLMSISDAVAGSEKLKGAYFCLEGDPTALDVAADIVASLEGNSFSIPAKNKPLYHAGAVASSGHIVALIDIAAGLFEKCGLDRDFALQVLLPLVRSTIDNLGNYGIERSLTGPFVRGDLPTFELQWDGLRAKASLNEIELYLDLAIRSVEIAQRENIGDPSLVTLQERLLIAKETLQ